MSETDRDTALDPQAIVQRMACYDFPWDMTRSLELALFRTYCVPSISALLDRTGEFGERPQKRYDDTDLLISTLMENGYDSAAGQAALRRINAVHGRFAISNEDFLYVLSTFVFVPLAWLDRFGWRRPADAERLALFAFWREVGRRMGIRDIPETCEAFQRYFEEYERTHYAYADSNRRVGEATRELFASWFPRPLRPLVRASVHALLDPPTRRAFGFPEPSARMARWVERALRARARLLRPFPRKKPRLRTRMRHRSYPGGWTLSDLGPPWIAGKATPRPGRRPDRG